MKNREIKFRAWDERGIYYGGFAIHATGSLINDNIHFGSNLTIMQFTGLIDRKGKDIYEGDIIQLGDVIAPITWEDGSWQMITSLNQGKSVAVQDRVKRFEVIGNIYKNPELLK